MYALANGPASVRSRTERDSLKQNPPKAAKAGAVRHFARVRYSHFLLGRARALSFLELVPSSSSCVSPPLPLPRATWSLAPSCRCSRRRCRALDTHIRCATADILPISPIDRFRRGDSGRSGYRDLPGRSRRLYHQEAQVTRE